MVNRIWPTAVAGKADSVSTVSASACHIGGPNALNPGQILLVYGTKVSFEKRFDAALFRCDRVGRHIALLYSTTLLAMNETSLNNKPKLSSPIKCAKGHHKPL